MQHEFYWVLQGSLDSEKGGEIAANLADLYDYCTRRLLHANLKNDLEAIQEIKRLISDVREAWAQVPELMQQQQASRERRLIVVIGSLDTGADAAALSEEITDLRPIEPGPLFKEIYSGLMDMENPDEWRPLLQKKYALFLPTPQIFIH